MMPRDSGVAPQGSGGAPFLVSLFIEARYASMAFYAGPVAGRAPGVMRTRLPRKWVAFEGRLAAWSEVLPIQYGQTIIFHRRQPSPTVAAP